MTRFLNKFLHANFVLVARSFHKGIQLFSCTFLDTFKHAFQLAIMMLHLEAVI